jgi:pimeloyl-ACP methyl ester carboxylesterase
MPISEIADIAAIAARRGAALVRANGTDIAYTETGDGPPLVLLHGALTSAGPAWAGSAVAFFDHLAALGEHFRVIAPDTRGSGATVHPGGPATFDVLADDVAALIDALGLGRPMIAGFSEGGTTATFIALRHPDVVGALVNHAGFDMFDPGAMAHQAVRPMFGGSPDAVTADPDAAERAVQAIPPMAATFATMKADYDDAQGDGHWRTYLGLFFDRAVAPVGYTVEDFAAIAAIAAPTLILTGDRDMFCSVEGACVAYRACRAGELGIVPGTGHEINTTVVGAMTDFLLRHSATG